MRLKLVDAFEDLYQEYIDAQTPEKRRIRLKLNEISMCYGECDMQERVFVDEITKKFCELIQMLREEKENEDEALRRNYATPPQNTFGFMTANAAPQRNAFFRQPSYRGQMPYRTGAQLLEAFYDYFVSDGEHKESTVKDYAARIKTFAERYLQTIPRVWEMYLYEREQGTVDTILFTYVHLELIIASFDTKGENGETNKQKNNIRSALRKLNDFKRMQEDAG